MIHPSIKILRSQIFVTSAINSNHTYIFQEPQDYLPPHSLELDDPRFDGTYPLGWISKASQQFLNFIIHWIIRGSPFYI